MPQLMTIPRELRDEIYSLTLSSPLPSSLNPSLQKPRKTISYSADDPEYHYGEEAARYPVHTSLPPSHGLLSTARQIRHEFLDMIKRRGPLVYKVDLTDRKDKGILAPTWLSVPILGDRVDVLEAHWRVRGGKTSSILSYSGEGEEEYASGDQFCTAVAMLQRFVERGIYLLSKKKRQKIHIGLLAIHMNIGAVGEISEEELDESVDEVIRFLDRWMVGAFVHAEGVGAREREEAQFRMLAGKVEKMQLFVKGKVKKEWVLGEMVEKRDAEDVVRRAEREG